MSHRDTSIAIKQLLLVVLWQMPRHDLSSYYYYRMDSNCSHHCNQCEVSILTNVFEVYILQVKVNRRISIPMLLSISHD